MSGVQDGNFIGILRWEIPWNAGNGKFWDENFLGISEMEIVEAGVRGAVLQPVHGVRDGNFIGILEMRISLEYGKWEL